MNGSLPVASASISGVVSTSTQTFAGEKNFTGTPWVQGSGPYIAFEETAGGYRGFGVSTYQNVMMISRTAANSRTFQNKNGQWGFAHNLETYKTGINNISPVSQFHVSVADATYKGLIVQGADSQTANLLELQNSAGTALWSIDSAGSLASGTVPVARVSGLATVATSGSYVDLTNKPTIPTDLDSLTDVTITTPAADQIIKYNGTAWVNSAAAAAGATTLDELTDVVIATPLKGHLVVHNGTNFVNSNTIETSGAAIKGLIVKGATDQTANSFEAQDSSGTAYVTINVDTYFGTAGQTAALFTRAPNNNKKALIARASAAPNGSTFEVQNNAGTAVLTVGSTGIIGLTPGDWNISGPSYLNIGVGSSGSFFSIGGNGQVGLNYGTTFDDSSQLSIVTRASQEARKGISVKYGSAGPTGNGYELLSSTATQLFAVSSSGAISAGNTTLTSTAAATKGLIVKGAASQTANLLELQNSAGTALVSVSSGGTLHAARYTETTANAFSTTLTPSTGTLTVDTSTGSAVLGTLAAAVTTWAFTNVPTENSKVTTVTAVLVGNASYTYGDACSVNGVAVTNGIMWSGGTAPTATAGTDLITFVVVKDSAGTIKVLGSATTNFS